jgi:hypothetical protein
MSRGFWNASCTAFFVISLKTRFPVLEVLAVLWVLENASSALLGYAGSQGLTRVAPLAALY